MKIKTIISTVVIAITLCLSSFATAQQRNLTIVNFGGANARAQNAAFLWPFAKKTGINVISVAYNGESQKIEDMVHANKVVWDMVEVETADLYHGCNDGIYENIDWAKILNKSN